MGAQLEQLLDDHKFKIEVVIVSRNGSKMLVAAWRSVGALKLEKSHLSGEVANPNYNRQYQASKPQIQPHLPRKQSDTSCLKTLLLLFLCLLLNNKFFRLLDLFAVCIAVSPLIKVFCLCALVQNLIKDILDIFMKLQS